MKRKAEDDFVRESKKRRFFDPIALQGTPDYGLIYQSIIPALIVINNNIFDQRMRSFYDKSKKYINMTASQAFLPSFVKPFKY